MPRALVAAFLLALLVPGSARGGSGRALVSDLASLPWRPSEGLELVGTPAPAWTGIEWIQGGPLTLQLLRGKVVLLRFWLTDCPYCTRTAPALNALQRKYAEQGLVVVGLHHPKSEYTRRHDVVRAAAHELEFRFPIGTDDRWKTLDRYWTGVPGRSFTSVTFVIDRAGIIRFLHDGGAFFEGPGEEGRAYEAIETMIVRLLAESAPTSTRENIR
jgi:peroxiredoxin